MLDEINDVEQEYDKLEIRDKNFYAKRRKKIALIVTPILLVLIAAIITLIILFRPKEKYNSSIICKYQTKKDNERINLIDERIKVGFSLIIDGVRYNNKYYHIFEKAGIYNVIFEFEQKIDRINSLFFGNYHLIEIEECYF